MNYSDMILEFLDGSLPEESQAELFSELSLNSDLRLEINDHVRMKNSFHTDLYSYAPAPTATVGVLSALGATTAAATTAATLQGPVMNFISTSATKIVSAVFAGSISTLLFIYSMGLIGDGAEGSAHSVAASVVHSPITNMASSSTDGTSSAHIAAVPAPQEEHNANTQAMANTYEDEMASDKTEYAQYVSQITEAQNIAYAAEDQYQLPINQLKTNNSVRSDNDSYEQINVPISFKTPITQDFSIMYRNLQSNSVTPIPTQLDKADYNMLSEQVFSLMYDINSWLSIGWSIGRERFYLKFEGTSKNNGATENYTYHRNPPITWTGPMLKLAPISIYGVEPYGQLTYGINEIESGHLVRAAGGLKYHPFSNFLAVTAGYEFSWLTYNYQNSQYLTEKYSFFWGLSINLY